MFLPKYVNFNILKFSGVWNSFLSLYSFSVQKCKNQRFEENKGIGALFIDLNCRWLQTGLADLKKKMPNT